MSLTCDTVVDTTEVRSRLQTPTAQGSTLPAGGAALDAVLRGEDPELFAWTGGLHAEVVQKVRSQLARDRLGAAWPSVTFKVRTVSAKRTDVGWTNGPSPHRVDDLLDTLFPAGRKPSKLRLERARTATLSAVAQVLVTEHRGKPYRRIGDLGGRARQGRPSAAESAARHGDYTAARARVFAGEYVHSALRVSEEQFDAAHALAPVLLAVAGNHLVVDAARTPTSLDHAVVEALADAIEHVGLDSLRALAG